MRDLHAELLPCLLFVTVRSAFFRLVLPRLCDETLEEEAMSMSDSVESTKKLQTH